MIDAAEVFESYLIGVARLTGAASATLFLPASAGGGVEAKILHVGEPPVVPELRDLDTARSFAAEATRRISDSWLDDHPEWLIVLPSGLDGGRLLPIHYPAVSVAGVGGQSTTARRRQSDREYDEPVAWIGIRLQNGESQIPSTDRLRRALKSPEEGSPTGLGGWLVGLGGAIAAYNLRLSGLIGDSVAGLPGRSELQGFLSEAIATAQVQKRGLALFFINPDDFGNVNERFGREAGDRVMREISGRLLAVRRRGDLVARFGGAIFASVLVNTTVSNSRELGERFRLGLTQDPYLDGAVRLGFSVGVACVNPDADPIAEPLALIRRADQALGAAKRAGGGVVTIWSSSSEVEQAENLDSLTGVFTGNMAKDYRNMVLLWSVLGAIAGRADPDSLADEVLSTLFSTIKPERIALLAGTGNGDPTPTSVVTRERRNGQAPTAKEDFRLADDVRPLVTRALGNGRPVRELVSDLSDGLARSVCILPLLLEDTTLGCLYLEGSPGGFVLDDSDLIFLQALAAQLAVALDRARLAEQEKGRQADESRRLRAELNDLRTAIKQSRLVFQSPQMESLLTTTRRVASTEATVLITGESGTGKELLARTLHEVSPRREGPFEVVDCSSIAPTLIESELFGHERGAFTGAQTRSRGRLVQAQRGTVLLDEVSELPLEVQSRLLRFVQEKELTSVGGTRSKRLDVRIVAATNRNLEAEVAAGRFREDLFYRLNVVRLLLPPLRERADDVVLLARHYLENFALTYQKSVRRMSPEVERLLTSHSWPGNVRELQNRLLQAVVLCDGDVLGVEHLGSLGPAGPAGSAARTESSQHPPQDPEPDFSTGIPSAENAGFDRSWDALRVLLARHVETAISSGRAAAHPLGTWLAEDLVLAAHDASSGVVRQAASRIGMAETTFGRRLRTAQTRSAAGLCARPRSWDPVRDALAQLVETSDNGSQDGDLLHRGERLLLETIVNRLPGDVSAGSALLGVTPPTFRRRLADIVGVA